MGRYVTPCGICGETTAHAYSDHRYELPGQPLVARSAPPPPPPSPQWAAPMSDVEAIRQGIQEALDSYNIQELISIVTDLAETGAPYDHEYGDCLLCVKIGDPACMWRRAVEWAQAHPIEADADA